MNRQRKRIVPNVVRGGAAIPIGNNLYYMKGRKHEQGGIDIGNNARTGLEVEGGEVVQTSPDSLKVFSSIPFLYGESPANLVMSGANPNDVFNAQERYKDINKLNDDGTRKKRNGGNKKLDSLVNYVLSRPANFVQRLNDNNRKTIKDWQDSSKVATHKLGAEYTENGTPIIYPNVQEIDGELVDFTRPPYDTWAGLDNAIEKEDTVQTRTLQDAIDFTKNYKDYIDMKQYRKGGARRLDLSSMMRNKGIPAGYITDFRGGDFGGAGASSSFKENEYTDKLYDYIRNTPIVTRESFTDAYRNAVNSGLSEFEWNGRRIKVENSDNPNYTRKEYRNSISGNIREILDEDMNVIPDSTRIEPYIGQIPGTIKREYKNGGLSRSKDYDTSKKPYPSVKSKDFAGENRSYPIPTKADAVDALRLAGLHGRSDVKAKVYRKYPELRKKAPYGTERERRADILLHTPIRFRRNRQPEVDAVTYASTNEIVPDIDFIPVGSNPWLSVDGYDEPFGIGIARINNNRPSNFQLDFVPYKIGYDINPNINNNIRRFFINTLPTGDVVAEEDVQIPQGQGHSQDQQRVVGNPSTGGTTRSNSNTTVPLPTLGDIDIPEIDNTSLVQPINIGNNRVEPVTPIPVRSNPDYTNLILNSIGSLANIGGNVASYLINRNMINDLEYSAPPIPLLPAKLKTRININPQLQRLYRDLGTMEDAVNNNTASSRTALARNQRLRNQTIQAANELYGNRENVETQLINRDRLNQQQVAANNINQYNRWLQGKTEFENNIRNLRSENSVALTQGMADAISGFANTIAQSNLEARNLGYLQQTNPYAVDALSDDAMNGLLRRNGYIRLFKCGGKSKSKK